MKYFFLIASFISMIMISGVSYAAESSTDIIINNGGNEDCGLVETTDGVGGMVINPNDASICQQDVVGNSIYFMFAKVIEEVEILQTLLKTSNGVKETAIGLGVGDPIVTVLATITTLVLMFGSIIITVTTVAGLLKSTGGEFLGEKWDTGKVIARVGGSITLMMPIAGGLSLIQISVLVVALLANIGGNYVAANFLNLVQVKSTQINSNEESMSDLSIGQTNNLISGELCMKRTSQKLLEDNYIALGKDFKTNSFLNSDTFIGHLIGYDKENLTVKETMDRYDACMTPANIVKIDDLGGVFNFDDNETKYISNFARGSIDTCKEDKYAYDENLYGATHTCSYTNYSYKDLSDLEGDDVDDSILAAVKSFRGQFAGYSEYESVADLEPLIKKKLEEKGSISFITPKGESADKELYDAFAPIVKSLKDKIHKSMESELLSNDDIKSDPNVRYEAVFAYHQYVLNNLMGAYFSTVRVQGSGRMSGTYSNKNIIETERTDDINSFAHKIIDDFALPAADFLEKSHCAKNWESLKNSRKTVRVLNEKMDTLTTRAGLSFGFECVNVQKDGENITLEFNTIENEFKDIDQDPQYIDNAAIKNKAIALHKKQISPQAENEARIKQMTLSLWFYVARKAVLASLSEEIKITTDELTPASIRQQGWGGLGGYMLAISGNQKNANRLYENLLTNIKWGQSISQGATDYVNRDAYELSDRPDEDGGYNATFKKMNYTNFFSSTGKRALNAMGVEESVEDNDIDGMTQFLYYIEKMLTSPMKYLEQASGIDRNETDLSFRAAIKECSKAGDCKIGDTHPLNALMQFGHELVTITTSLMIAEIVITKLADFIDGKGDKDGQIEGGDKEGSGKNTMSKFLSFLGGVAAVLTMLIKFAAVVLQVLSPLTLTLLFVGILFAYIVPTIPYVAFTIVLINWIILIIELMITMPIWLAMYAITNEDGSGKTDVKMLWNFYGQLLLKPAFVVIALVVGWGISSISLYIINMTAFSSYIGSSLNNSSMTGIIDLVMFYIIYVIMAFVAIKQSFTVINTLPDTIFSRLNIQSTGDSQMIGELGVERLLQAAAIQDVLSNIQGGIKQNMNGKSDKEKNVKLEEELAEARKIIERLQEQTSQSPTDKGSKK